MRSCSNQIKSQQQIQLLVFGERGKAENPGKNLSEQSREPTTSTTLCFVCYFLLISLQLINHSKLLTQPLNYEKRLVAMKSQCRQRSLRKSQLLNGCKNKKQ